MASFTNAESLIGDLLEDGDERYEIDEGKAVEDFSMLGDKMVVPLLGDEIVVLLYLPGGAGAE